MNQAAIPGADAGEGTLFCPGAGEPFWGRGGKEEVVQGVYPQNPEASCLYGKPDDWQVPEKLTVGLPAAMGGPGAQGAGAFSRWDGLSLGVGLPVRTQVSLALGLQPCAAVPSVLMLARFSFRPRLSIPAPCPWKLPCPRPP